MMYTSYDVYESHRFFLFLQELWQRVLQTEWGGMNDVLFYLYSLTKDKGHLATARRFNAFVFTSRLADGNTYI